MKKFVKFLLVLAIVPGLILSSCKKDEDDDPNPDTKFETLKTYMIDNSLDLSDLLVTWVIAPTLITNDNQDGIVDSADFSIPGYHVLDIRSEAVYDEGHIKDAINTTLADIITTADGLSKDKPILVACFTGQTAGHAVMALRLSGYPDAQVMKFGMAGWHTDFASPWEDAIGNPAVGNANWTTTPTVSPTFNYPELTTTATDGAGILAERIEELIGTIGFQGVASGDVLNDPSPYHIANYWSTDEYTTFGHYLGAFPLKPITLAGDEVKSIDPSGNSLIYCFTGQTSSMVVAWLNVLGYQAKSIKYGVNSLSYDALVAAEKPHWHGAADFDYYPTK